MNKICKSLKPVILALLVTTACFSCKEDPKHQPPLRITRIQTPVINQKIVLGEEIPIQLKLKEDKYTPDSFHIVLGHNISTNFDLNTLSGNISTKGLTVGHHTLRVELFFKKNRKDAARIQVEIFPAIEPVSYSYKVVNTYPHDIDAYTQGLVYEDGILYEGTGERGKSSLRKVSLEDGKVIQKIDLPKNIFGEGIGIVDDKIYQLTYKAQKAFVYDKESFEEIQQFNYPYTEGWGMHYNGEHLIMTDKSNNLYFIDPQYFTEVKRVPVYDNNGPVNQINELEMIDGKLYANVYLTNLIAIIDPATGVVEATIDLSGLLSPSDKHANIDVLNGIAYDEENNRIFVTGKNWPKLFEIKLIKN